MDVLLSDSNVYVIPIQMINCTVDYSCIFISIFDSMEDMLCNEIKETVIQKEINSAPYLGPR